jgi:tRNA(Ile)-lysidine synthase TilS/MesJ
VARLQQTLSRQIGRANRRFGLKGPGDERMVAISGGERSLLALVAPQMRVRA